MDRMDWMSHLKSCDNVRMSGRVTFVGKSSMEVTVRVEKKRDAKAHPNRPYKLVAIAKFTMVK